ncbi:RNA-binding protein [Plasmodium gonderi]|uniref:RNA-binding protein n=1 Tax=Plasmodium gonderi TaxID=77519 RepID=A0A1Y1JJM7_PLAGO|nr:RNA-binding protein [Plasmodium gonderi]GAW81407.1 RNA-binding protein [Plasmodium gonderi]
MSSKRFFNILHFGENAENKKIKKDNTGRGGEEGLRAEQHSAEAGEAGEAGEADEAVVANEAVVADEATETAETAGAAETASRQIDVDESRDTSNQTSDVGSGKGCVEATENHINVGNMDENKSKDGIIQRKGKSDTHLWNCKNKGTNESCTNQLNNVPNDENKNGWKYGTDGRGAVVDDKGKGSSEEISNNEEQPSAHVQGKETDKDYLRRIEGENANYDAEGSNKNDQENKPEGTIQSDMAEKETLNEMPKLSNIEIMKKNKKDKLELGEAIEISKMVPQKRNIQEMEKLEPELSNINESDTKDNSVEVGGGGRGSTNISSNVLANNLNKQPSKGKVQNVHKNGDNNAKQEVNTCANLINNNVTMNVSASTDGNSSHRQYKEQQGDVKEGQIESKENMQNKSNVQIPYNSVNGERFLTNGMNNASNVYLPNGVHMNSYYDMYNYGYSSGVRGSSPMSTGIADSGNVSSVGGMINLGNTTNLSNTNYNNNYYYYYSMYDDYNIGMEEDMMKAYGYCSILNKSIELMKKSDKVKEILKRPAKLQVTQEELNKVEYTEGSDQYNIWFGKYVIDKYDKSFKGPSNSTISSSGCPSGTQRFVAKYKCKPSRDSGYTKADKNLTSKQFFCIYFARGCCAYGHNCLYRHRIPNENDEIQFETTVDIFGREKFSTFKEDMTGVGNFNSDCRTLFIGSLHIDNFNEVPLIEKILYDEFSNFGNIDYVRFIPYKNIAFVQYTNRVNAEFAKVAMADQPIENHSTALTIKWAFELRSTPHHSFQYYTNPYVYNQSPLVSSTWQEYVTQQQQQQQQQQLHQQLQHQQLHQQQLQHQQHQQKNHFGLCHPFGSPH